MVDLKQIVREACGAHTLIGVRDGVRLFAAERCRCKEILAALEQATADLRQDKFAALCALGYPSPGEYDGKMSDGTTPVCGLCDAKWREIERLTKKCKDLTQTINEETDRANEYWAEVERLKEEVERLTARVAKAEADAAMLAAALGGQA